MVFSEGRGKHEWAKYNIQTKSDKMIYMTVWIEVNIKQIIVAF